MSALITRYLLYVGLILSSWQVHALDAPTFFDRATSAERYRAWIARFEHDLLAYQQALSLSPGINDDQIEAIFAASIVPHSRAIANVKDIFGRHRPAYSASGGIVFSGIPVILLEFLKKSYPAGYGGSFQEPAGSAFTNGLSVWYMHIQVGGPLDDTYFSSSKHFDFYELPPYGVLKRRAFPFLLFEDDGQMLRWGGIGQEYWNAVEITHGIQFH